MSAQAERSRAHYRRAFKDRVKIARATGTGAAATIAWDEMKWVRAHVMGYVASDAGGTQTQGLQSVLLLAEDLDAIGFQAPRAGDRIRMPSGAIALIDGVDANTRRAGAALIAYEVKVKGA